MKTRVRETQSLEVKKEIGEKRIIEDIGPISLISIFLGLVFFPAFLESIEINNYMRTLYYISFIVAILHYSRWRVTRRTNRGNFKKFIYQKNNLLSKQISINNLNHHNYFHNIGLIKSAQKSIWQEIYKEKFLLNILSYLMLSIIYIFILGVYISGINNKTDYIPLFSIPFITSFIFLVFVRIRYIREIINPLNTYIFQTMTSNSYFFGRKINKDGGYNYIFYKNKNEQMSK